MGFVFFLYGESTYGIVSVVKYRALVQIPMQERLRCDHIDGVDGKNEG